ncbi:hypothetical protein BGZ98_001442 [Dissophora globulifera]|nr:hypothetical protein BGZ98_001442 [Dissophora globulifera]
MESAHDESAFTHGADMTPGRTCIPPAELASTWPPPQDYSALPGLQLIYDFVSADEEAALVQQLDARPWAGKGVEPNPEMKRRHQHYGGVFSYRLR